MFSLLLCILFPRYSFESVCNFGWEYTCACIYLSTHSFMNQLFIQVPLKCLSAKFYDFVHIHFEKTLLQVCVFIFQHSLML